MAYPRWVFLEEQQAVTNSFSSKSSSMDNCRECSELPLIASFLNFSCLLRLSCIRRIQLMRSLVTSFFLYACESWTLTAELQRKIQAMEMRCYWKILHISFKDHVTNEEVPAKIQQAFGPHKDLLMIVKRCKRGYKPWKWGATERFHASHTKTMFPMRKYVSRSSTQLDRTKTSWPL